MHRPTPESPASGSDAPLPNQEPQWDLRQLTELYGEAPPAPVAAPAPERSAVERDALYAEFQPLVRRLTRKYGSTPEMREEMVGEIYHRFCALFDAHDPDRGIPLRQYLVRMLTASVYTYARSQWRQQSRETQLEPIVEDQDPALVTNPSADWDADLMQQQVLSSLPEAIACLPARQKKVVIWRYYDGRSFEEIADLLQVRPATARSLLRHGLASLRKHMVPAAPESE